MGAGYRKFVEVCVVQEGKVAALDGVLVLDWYWVDLN
jgi:hypothetical protein